MNNYKIESHNTRQRKTTQDNAKQHKTTQDNTRQHATMTITMNASDMLNLMPQDIINHIGRFYITKEMKLRWRLDKLYNKCEELEKRTIDEWIEHIKFSKRYNIKIVKINNDYIKYTNSFGDTYKMHKNDLLIQGYIAHIRNLYRMYENRILRETIRS